MPTMRLTKRQADLFEEVDGRGWLDYWLQDRAFLLGENDHLEESEVDRAIADAGVSSVGGGVVDAPTGSRWLVDVASSAITESVGCVRPPGERRSFAAFANAIGRVFGIEPE